MTALTRHRLAELATHGVVTLPELRSEGVRQKTLETMLRREHLFRRHPGVFLTMDQPGPKALALAAVRHCGADALVSFLWAAFLWDLIDTIDGAPIVTVPAYRMTHGADGVQVKRTRRPDRGWTRDDIPVTSLHRTLDDIARGMTDSALKAAVGRAERKHALQLDELYAEARSAMLKRVLRTYTAGRGRTDSELEARFYDIVAGTTLHRFEMQQHRSGGRVDFVF